MSQTADCFAVCIQKKLRNFRGRWEGKHLAVFLVLIYSLGNWKDLKLVQAITDLNRERNKTKQINKSVSLG